MTRHNRILKVSALSPTSPKLTHLTPEQIGEVIQGRTFGRMLRI